jgi:hypothetical protein
MSLVVSSASHLTHGDSTADISVKSFFGVADGEYRGRQGGDKLRIRFHELRLPFVRIVTRHINARICASLDGALRDEVAHGKRQRCSRG